MEALSTTSSSANGRHWDIANEFSCMAVELDLAGRSPRIRLLHRVSGRDMYLDALQLEALLTLRPEDLWRLLDPSDLGNPIPRT
jgi:hypothetical protein